MPLTDPPPLGRLPFEPPEHTPDPDLMRFWDLWRQEKFWACHEALEGAWRRETQATRRLFLQGLIHGAVAVFHFRRGNFVGASRQLVRAQVRLGALPPCQKASEEPCKYLWEGVDVERFLRGVAAEIAPSLESLSEKDQAGLEALEARLEARLEAGDQWAWGARARASRVKA